MSVEAPIAHTFQRFSVQCLLVGLFAEAIDILSQLRPSSNSMFQEIRMPQRPKRLLARVRACPELAEGAASNDSR